MAGFEKLQSRLQNRVLHFWISRTAERVAVGKGNQERAGGANLHRELAQELEDDRADAGSLQFRGDQTHGLIAHRSHRHEERHIHSL